jgi:biopolymer transport protein ExbD
MPIDRVLTKLLLATAAVLSTGCDAPAPAARVVLHISATGEYSLDGKSIPAAGLKDAFAARKAQGADLEVEVRASPKADIKFVQSAIEATTQAHARMFYAHEDGTP